MSCLRNIRPPANHEAAPVNNAAHAEQQVSQIEVGPLKEVFDEFRAELGEMGGEEEDLETHYNLGIAFREMGLLDEAISEFQKVAKAAERGRPFPYVMQCYTLLGLAFMDRGQPSIAAMWYERALRLPNVETESMRSRCGMIWVWPRNPRASPTRHSRAFHRSTRSTLTIATWASASPLCKKQLDNLFAFMSPEEIASR